MTTQYLIQAPSSPVEQFLQPHLPQNLNKFRLARVVRGLRVQLPQTGSTSMRTSIAHSSSVENPEEAVRQPESDGRHAELNFQMLISHMEDVERELREKDRLSVAGHCLQNHTITPIMRAHMVDWMVEVTDTYECCDQTFFLSILFLDNYYARHPRVENPEDLHLTGIVCMFLASKYADAVPLKMALVHEKIAQGAFSLETLKAKEREVLATLGFEFLFPTLLEFLETDSMYLEIANYGKEDVSRILKLAAFLAKMACYDYKFSSYRASQVSAFIIAALVKDNERLGKGNIVLTNWVKELTTKNAMDTKDLQKGVEMIFSLQLEFADRYGGSNSLFTLEGERLR